MKIQLLADDLEKMARLHEQETAKDMKLTAMRVDVLRATKKLYAMTYALASLRPKLGVLHTTEEQRRCVLQDFLQKASTCSSALMGTHATTYRS